MIAPDPRRALHALRRFTRAENPPAPCDLCAAALAAEHDHLVEPETRRLVCACRGCALLFPDSGEARYRLVRTRAVRLEGLRVDDATLDALGIPVRLAVLCPSKVHSLVFALFPNAAGATEATISLAAWDDLLRLHPVLSGVEPDVEALLIDQLGGRSHCFIASLPVCHHFAGLLRGRPGARDVALAAARAYLDALAGGGHA